MPYKEKEPTKLYYTIGEVSKMFNVNASLIRFWETEFSILKPKKNNKGNRLFTPSDIENLKKIFHLVKERGYTLDGAKKELKVKNPIILEETDVIKTLKNARNLLMELKNSIK